MRRRPEGQASEPGRVDGAFDWVPPPSRAVPSLSLHAAWHRHAVVKALQPPSAPTRPSTPVETRDGEWGCGRRVGCVAFLNRWDRTDEETGSHGKRLETAIVDTFLSHPRSLRAPNFATDGKVRAHRREAAGAKRWARNARQHDSPADPARGRTEPREDPDAPGSPALQYGAGQWGAVLALCVCERVCESVRACAGSSQGPGPWLTSRARATPAPRSPRSHQPVGEAVPRAGLCAAGVGRVLPRGPGSPLPTSRKPLTVMAKPFVRGSRWCLRLGSPLAWATCMLIWCFFSVKRVPSQ